MNIEPSNIKGDWITILEGTSEEKFIASTSENGKYCLIDNENKQYQRLSVQKIVSLSKEEFDKTYELFYNNKIDVTEFNSRAKKIIESTEKIIDRRKQKIDQTWLASSLARLVAIVSRLIFGFEVDLWNEKFKHEITTMMAKSMIPDVIKSISTIRPEDRLSLFRKQMDKDFPKNPASTDPVPQFVVDMERDISFIRIEQGEGGIRDTTSQPPLKMEPKARVKKGINALQALLKTEKDKRWEKTLQLLATQTNFNNIFDPFIFIFDLQAPNNLWTDPIDQVGYALHPIFPNKTKPPIQLEIFRDENGSIKEVRVTLEGYLDIVRRAISGKNANQVKDTVAASAIKGNLKYRVTLDQDNHPLIDEFSSVLEPVFII